jgi:hypothetical protein
MASEDRFECRLIPGVDRSQRGSRNLTAVVRQPSGYSSLQTREDDNQLLAKSTCGAYATWNHFVSDVRSHISAPGAVVVRRLPYGPDVDMLPRLASSLGKLSRTDVTAPEANQGSVHAVEAKLEPLKDSHGFLILSTTSRTFPCHTDDYFDEQPSDIVLLHCVRQAEVGGDSLIAYFADILSALDQEMIDVLRLPHFPTHFGPVAILGEDKAVRSIRYNRLEIQRSSTRLNMSLSQKHQTALDALDAAIERATQLLRLAPGDCLTINNKTVVHGRTAFASNGGRLFRRVKIHT